MILLIFSILLLPAYSTATKNVPIVVNTWGFTSATAEGEQIISMLLYFEALNKYSEKIHPAWDVLETGKGTAIDGIVAGCSVCEREQCDGTVGYGGSPDENSETTLDALLMDGQVTIRAHHCFSLYFLRFNSLIRVYRTTMNVGAVAAMRNIKHAISVAKYVLWNTQHTLLVGERATEFALMMGFTNESLSTPSSMKIWQQWHDGHCQPNFWMVFLILVFTPVLKNSTNFRFLIRLKNVVPDPRESCGPYEPLDYNDVERTVQFGSKNHDTIGMIACDRNGNIAAGTSTNGARHKIPG